MPKHGRSPIGAPPARPKRKKKHPPASRPVLTDAGRGTKAPGLHVRLTHISGLTDPSILRPKEPWHFQCPPMEPFSITRGHDSQEYETIYDGSFSVNASAKLDTVQFKTLFVEDDHGFVLFDYYDLDNAKDLLANLSKSGTPVHLMCSHRHGTRPEYSGPVTLTDYVHTENEPYAYYADVTFKQYPDPTVDGVVHKRPGGRSWPKHIKLTSADTLYSLASKYYGKASAARQIASANHIRTISFGEAVVKAGGKWKVGATITLPEPPPAKPVIGPPRRIRDTP